VAWREQHKQQPRPGGPDALERMAVLPGRAAHINCSWMAQLPSLMMPARIPASTAALRPARDVRASARRTPPSGGADRPERLRGRRRPRMPKPQRVEKLWPVDLPDGSEELEAVAE
jgi:hypothetical protein